MKNSFRTIASAVALAALGSSTALAGNTIRVVGSSTVYPFTTAVAEQFAASSGNPAPIVESTGTGGGFKLFCAGMGDDTPDVTNASRAIKKSEFEDCAKHGVTNIVEVKIGFDGLSIANAKAAPELSLTKAQLFLVLAKEVPGADGKLIANPYVKWSDIDPSLPAEKIEVLGPPPTSGTRDSFLELVMDKGAETIESLAALKQADAKAYEKVWKSVREDGAWIDSGENDNLIVQKLEANPAAVGVFGFSFLDANGAAIKGASVDGVAPSFETIADGSYKVARPLFIYVKKDKVGKVAGLAEFVGEFTSDKAIGSDGYLADKGLVPMPADELTKVRDAVMAMTPLSADKVN